MTIVTQAMHAAKIAAKNPAKCTINKSYNHVSSYCYNCSTLLREGVLPGGVSVRGLPKYSTWPKSPDLMLLVSLASGGVPLPSWRGAATLLESYNIKQAKHTK